MLVAIPKIDGIEIINDKIDGCRYVYKHIDSSEANAYEDKMIIGIYDEETERMMPTSNYFKSIYKLKEVEIVDIKNYGLFYVARKCCSEMGLTQCLKDVFGSKELDLILLCLYIFDEGESSFQYIKGWLESLYVPNSNIKMTKETAIDLLSNLSFASIYNFFAKWGAINKTSKLLCYDVKSFSSYDKWEYMFAQKQEVVSACNLSIFCDEETKMPIYYHEHDGFIIENDNFSDLEIFMKRYDINDVKFILDGESLDPEDFDVSKIKSNFNNFTLILPTQFDVSKKMISKHISNICQDKYKLNKNEALYCIQEKMNIQGVVGKLLIYFDQEVNANYCAKMDPYLNYLSSELSDFDSLPDYDEIDRYSKYFEFNKHDDDIGFDFQIKEEFVKEMKLYQGSYFIFTTDLGDKPKDVLSHYDIAREDLKIQYKQIAFETTDEGVITHSEEFLNGKKFIIFIKQIIKKYMLSKINLKFFADLFSFEIVDEFKSLIKELNEIQVSFSRSGKGLDRTLTDYTKKLLAFFDAEEGLLKSLIPKSKKK
ncbi:MAG: hypothetical protein LBU04_07750 [Christensenellaceae bacterium]|jgi:hypothetical protein|nr:hypothetical protein [Christensenellaceae bacterium]